MADDSTLPPNKLEEAATLPPRSSNDLPRDFGHYRLERLLGRGGMGEVYLAHDTRLGRQVALKIPSLSGKGASAIRVRFLREAQSAAALQHPNICPVFEVGEIDGSPYMTMAYIAGDSLTQRIDPRRPFAPREAVALVRKLALALDAAHVRGVIHRDLKPGNVLFDAYGEPMVLDFGLARRADLVGEQLTQQGDVLGTPAYMPPEQITGEIALIGPACDIYSLGVILYELLTGEVPFRGDILALVSQVPLDEPTPPSRRRPGLDSRLDAICSRALAKKPAERFFSMREFADTLTAWLDGDSGALTLRIVGTPYSYRPLPNQTLISVGRQRRKPGDPDDTGNDMVLRVPGDDLLSARISRRHFEIERDGEAYRVTDRSKVGTLLNGRPLTWGVSAPLASGDRIVVAGVVELEVVLDRSAPTTRLTAREVRVGAAGALLEATLGDMITSE